MHRFLTAALLFLLASLAGKTQVVINEVNIAGPAEFIELYNKSSCAVDLACYTLVFSGTSGGGNPTGWTVKIPAGKSIATCGYFLIGGLAGTAGVAGGTGYPNGGSSTPYPSADLNIGTPAITANAVYMKQGVIAGSLPNSSGQITLLDPANTVVASISYNSGNNTSTYPLSAYLTCNVSGNTQGANNIPNPGTSVNNINASFTGGGLQGISLTAANVYVTTSSFTPGSANLSQLGCAPAITAPFAASPVCFSNAAQQTELAYSGTTNSPTQYSINWDITPVNSFATVINAILPASPIVITVPAGTLPGAYTGYLTVSNTSGTSCTPVPFSVTVNPSPTVDAGNYGQLCFNGAPVTLTGSPAGGVFSGTGVSGNSFTPFAGGTYAVQYSFTDVSTGCSATTAANILVHPQPLVNVSPSSSIICQNSSGVNLTASGATTYTWSPSAGLSGITGNSVAANPSSNTVYTVTGTDANGCINSAMATVTISPSPSLPQVTLLQPTCLTAGTIQVISPAGTGYHFSVDGTNYLNNGGVFMNVAPGSYAVRVKDAAGCISLPANVVIEPLPGAPTNPAVSVQHPSCGTNTGTLTVASPAGAEFSYSVDGINFQPTTIFSNLAPGNYTVTVKNSEGCTATATATIHPAPVVPTAPVVTVINHCNGTSTLTANGVTGSLLWSNGATGNPVVVSAAGNYSVTQTVDGCTSSSGHGMAVPGLPPQSPALVVVQPTCTSAAGALIITSPLGPGYVYSINGGPYTAPTNYSGLHAGDHVITVQNSEGCEASAIITIDPQPQTPESPAVTITQPTCTIPTGTISVLAPPAGHHYSIDGVNYTNTSGAFSNLLPGVYSVTEKNSQGCVSAGVQAVINAQPAAPTAQVNSPAICAGAAASIIATPSPAGSYHYTWTVPAGATNPANVASFAASVAGNYSVTVTNNNGCSGTGSGTLSITAFATITAENKQVCVGSVVSLSGHPAGGIWSGPSVTGSQFDASGLGVGNYAVTYSYTSGSCSGSATATITVNPVPAAPVVQVVHPNCSGRKGSIMVQSPMATGLEYSIDGTNFQSGPTFTNLNAGTYAVCVRNANGCISTFASATIHQATGTVQTFSTHCIPEDSTYLFNGQLLATTGNYSTTYLRAGLCDSIVNLYLLVARTETQSLAGCSSYVYGSNTYFSSTSVRDTIASVVTNCDSLYRVVRITVNPEPITTIAACLPAGQTYHFNGQVLRSSGRYTVVFHSANGCDSTVNLSLTITTVQTQDTSSCDAVIYSGVSYKSDTALTIIIPSLLTGCDSVIRIINIAISPKPAVTISGNKIICRGDSVHLTASADSASIKWPGFGTSSNLTVAPAATTSYMAIATALGCTDTAEVTITVIDFNLRLTASSNPVIAGKNVELRTTGTSAYQVLSWQPVFGSASAKYQSIMADTTMLVRVKARSREGCIDSASLLLVVDPLEDIYIPTAFTPNGDGKNDRFVVGASSFKTFDLKVFNRWGQLVFTSAERGKGWDGRYAGKEQPAGTYVYSFIATLKNGRIVRRNGTVTLIR